MLENGWGKLLHDLAQLEQIETAITHTDLEIERMLKRRQDLILEKKQVRKLITMYGRYSDGF